VEVDVLEVVLEDASELDDTEVVDSSAVTVTTSVVKIGNGESIEDSILPMS
jgi:hypothetical protein